jgi:hypothetical protein
MLGLHAGSDHSALASSDWMCSYTASPNPDDNEIVGTTEDNLTIYPDLVIVVGTRLEILGARSIAKGSKAWVT